MNELADEQIELAKRLRVHLAAINNELALLRPPKRPRHLAQKMIDAQIPVTLGPLQADGTFYAHRDQFTKRVIVRCPTCGHRIG